jgi:hypothetical protein
MAATYIDQVMAYVIDSARQSAFISALGLGVYASKSFTRRYNLNNYQVESTTLGPLSQMQVQQAIFDDVRLIGTREYQDQHHRFHFHLYKQELLGWVDISFVTTAQFAVQAVPGTLALGQGVAIQQNGIDTPPLSNTAQLKFNLPLTTDTFTLTYTLQVFLFVSADLSPLNDLRRIQLLRSYLQADPNFLVSLDGAAHQRPFLFVQLYPADAANGGLVSQEAITALFDAADILVTFFTPPTA